MAQSTQILCRLFDDLRVLCKENNNKGWKGKTNSKIWSCESTVQCIRRTANRRCLPNCWSRDFQDLLLLEIGLLLHVSTRQDFVECFQPETQENGSNYCSQSWMISSSSENLGIEELLCMIISVQRFKCLQVTKICEASKAFSSIFVLPQYSTVFGEGDNFVESCTCVRNHVKVSQWFISGDRKNNFTYEWVWMPNNIIRRSVLYCLSSFAMKNLWCLQDLESFWPELSPHFILFVNFETRGIWVEYKFAYIGAIFGDKQSLRNYIVHSDGPNSSRLMRLEPDFSFLKWRMWEASSRGLGFLWFFFGKILNDKITWDFFMAFKASV